MTILQLFMHSSSCFTFKNKQNCQDHFIWDVFFKLQLHTKSNFNGFVFHSFHSSKQDKTVHHLFKMSFSNLLLPACRQETLNENDLMHLFNFNYSENHPLI